MCCIASVTRVTRSCVILEGEAAILDAAGNAIVPHGPSNVLGELNILSGQTVFVTRS